MGQGLRSIFERMGPDMPDSDILYPGTQYLLPVAVPCALSLLLTLLWLLAVWKYLWRNDTHSSESPGEWETAHQCLAESDMTGHLGEILK
jgi:hypothetical protein